MDNNEATFVGKNIIHLEDVDSTNSFALDLISKTNPLEGTCIIADYQSGGRGQIGRSWHSERAQNLLMSFVLYPLPILIEDQFALNMMTSLAVVDTLTNVGLEAKIKWPNDVYIGHQKICGILIQNVLRGDQIKASVVGIGLNVNQIEFPDVLPNPASIATYLRRSLDRMQVYNFLCERLEIYYLASCRQEYMTMMQAYSQRLYRINVEASFTSTNQGTFTGQIKGVDKDGRLRVSDESGQILSFAHGEIKFG
jgi:BirA family transcriptional regulator, biotin operon repressor / biotin---[acetyl-CoA-carboxylase] ligase